MSIDEISQRKGHKDCVTLVADIDQGKLIEMIDSHKQENIIEILIQQPLSVREQFEEVSVDMWGGFPKVVRGVFPNAKIVIDRFHVMKPVNTELDQIRRQVKITDKGVRFILLKNRADLSEQEEVKLTAILAHSKRLSIAYRLKEEFGNIYELSATVEEGKEKFKQWLLKAQFIYGKVVQTIRTHLLEICNYFINIAKHAKVDLIWVAGRSPALVPHSLRGVAMNFEMTTLHYLAIEPRVVLWKELIIELN